jgi:hypothetical protein
MRILFIGNSHTYLNGLPFQVRAMVDHVLGQGRCFAWMCATGGQTLLGHSGELAEVAAIRFHPWDHIVLQEATHPFRGYDALREGFDALEPHLRFSGAELLFYQTWSRRQRPHHQAELDVAFNRLATEKSLRVIPVADAWHRAIKQHPQLDLYDEDGSHASPAGTYLAACVFFAALTGLTTAELPARIETGGATLADLDPGWAVELQRVAFA